MIRGLQKLCLASIIGCLCGAATVVMAMPSATPPAPACLAIGSGVCFSGSVEWVAKAAAQLTVVEQITLSMSGDAV